MDNGHLMCLGEAPVNCSNGGHGGQDSGQAEQTGQRCRAHAENDKTCKYGRQIGGYMTTPSLGCWITGEVEVEVEVQAEAI